MSRSHNRRAWINRAATLAVGSLIAPTGISKALATPRPSDGQWPCWRGASRDGHSEDTAWPQQLGGLQKLWSVELGDSYSGPIITPQTVYTTQTIDKTYETLTALDRETGTTVWEKKWTGSMSVPFFAKSNGDWIRSTPATDGEKVVVGGIRDAFCSPLIDGDNLYIQAGGSVRRLNMDSGELVWSSLEDGGGMNGGAFSSPIIAELHGVRQLVVQTRSKLAGLDLETGNPLWARDVASFRGMNILTPTIWNNCVFTSSYGGKAELIGLIPGDKTWQTEVKWAGKAEAYMSSPLVVNDFLYMHLRNQRLCCLDLNSGEETWRTTPFGKYWSMITNGEQILALDERGELLLLECNPQKYKLLDRRQVSEEPSWAHLALAGRQLLVRRQRGLDAYQWNDPAAP